MARENLKGTSFCGLGLEKEEEKAIKKFLKDEDASAKWLLRKLVREFIRQKKLI